ncbi:MAG: DUF2066 domain-containing protein [Alphaproteobacteria bacterium]|nr:DUF2066 domain-containing protein [Alphaproteobacteria bacterium]
MAAMAKRQVARVSGRSALLLLLFSMALLALGAPPGSAQETRFYEASAIVTGTDMRSRPSGFAQCLREVLAKVSGEPRLAKDPRVAALAAHADRFVLSFDYVDLMAGIPRHDDQGTYDRPHDLSVRFDKDRIDAALAELGEHPWRGERPVIVPALLVHGPAATYLLSAENPAGAVQRASFAVMAEEFGMKVRFPSAAELADRGSAGNDVPVAQAASDPGEALVTGMLEFQEALPGWVGSWRMRWHDADYAWQIRGVNFDEAFRDIVRGVVRVASGHGEPD